MNLLQRLIKCQEETIDTVEEKVYKRGAMMYNNALNKPLYVEITTSPEGYSFKDGRSIRNLSIDVFDTSLDVSLNGVENRDGFVDCVYSPEKVELSNGPIAHLGGTLWLSTPTIDTVCVYDADHSPEFMGKRQDYTRKGIGKMCMQMAEEVYGQEGYSEIFASRHLTNGARYLSSKMKSLGKFGQWVCDRKYSKDYETNGKAGKEFLKGCGYNIDSHYMARHATKNLDRDYSWDKNLPCIPDALKSDTIPSNIKHDISKILSYPASFSSVAPKGKLLSQDIASIKNPESVAKFQVGGLAYSLDEIREISENKQLNNDLV